jgi:hypothetical protein
MSVQLRHPLAEIQPILTVTKLGDNRSEGVKTLLHEMTHHVHNVATAFGSLSYLIKVVQDKIAGDLMIEFLYAKRSLSPPLVSRINEFTRPTREQIANLLTVWYKVELFIMRSFGEIERHAKHAVENPYVMGVLPDSLFASMQRIIVQYCRRLKEEWPALFIETESIFPDFEEDDDQSLPDFSQLALDRLQWSQELSGWTYSLNGILESAGKTAEYLENFETSLETFKLAFQGNAKTMRGSFVTYPMQRALRHIPARSLPEFVWSYLIICDLSLNGPVLPQYRKLRKQPLLFDELTPIGRWYKLLDAADSVKPMEDREDCLRYTSALCERLEWATPAELFVLGKKAPIFGEFRRSLYFGLQQLRNEKPGFFLDPSMLFGPSCPTGLRVVAFNCPDGRIVDNPYAPHLTMDYLLRMCFRKLMIGSKREIRLTLPFWANSDERAWYEQELRSLLEWKWRGHFPIIYIDDRKTEAHS